MLQIFQLFERWLPLSIVLIVTLHNFVHEANQIYRRVDTLLIGHLNLVTPLGGPGKLVEHMMPSLGNLL